MAQSEGFFLLCQSSMYQRFHSWILYISLEPAQIKPAPCDLSWHWLSRVALSSYIYLAQCGLHAACGFERTRQLTQGVPAHPRNTVTCPQPRATAGAVAFHICRSARVTAAYKVIKCCALLFNKGVIWGEGGDVVLAGISQGTGGTTSCKIFSSYWLYTSSWSFHSSFTGSEGGGVAGRDSGPLMMLFSISSCLRLALGSGTVPQEVFMLNRSLVTLDATAEIVMQQNICWKESMQKSDPSLKFPVWTHLLLCKLPGVVQQTNKKYLSVEKDRFFHHCFLWVLQHELLKWIQHPSMCL